MRVLDLFSGIGGFSLGLERAGMKTVAFCEIEPYCQAVLRKHWPGVPIYDDIKTLTAERLGERGITVDLICGGFPCQDISSAGYKAGISGERSSLWGEFARLICELRPRYVVVENVSALLNRGASVVCGDLAEIGYDSEWHCISASMLGAPHHRDRFWLVAYPDHEGKPTGTKHDETRRMQKVKGNHAADTECRIRPLGWLLAGMRGNWECVTRNRTWETEDSPLGMGMDDGIPNRMDRLKSLGNSVIPQIPELIGRAIMSTKP